MAEVLRELGEAHYKDLTREIQERGLVFLRGQTPEATMNALISSEIKRRGNSSKFVRAAPGVYALRDE